MFLRDKIVYAAMNSMFSFTKGYHFIQHFEGILLSLRNSVTRQVTGSKIPWTDFRTVLEGTGNINRMFAQKAYYLIIIHSKVAVVFTSGNIPSVEEIFSVIISLFVDRPDEV